MSVGSPEKLESYFGGKWSRGDGVEAELVDPVNGSVLATASARGLDLKAALQFARQNGSPALRGLSFAARAKLIGAIADVLVTNRARYEAIAIANSGNTRNDAAIDIDGGIGTLKYYARLGAPFADARLLVDDKPARLTKAENFQAIHILVPRRGVAVHINAFNFPSWGLWEKAAVSLLAGVPFLVKPASATAMLSHAMVRDVVMANVLPAGAISLLCGSAGDILDHLTGEDIIAFTGSSATAIQIRRHPNVLTRGVPVNIEADSLNAALLAPDVMPGSPTFDAFVKEVVREMTAKAGQKCTAIRRIFVPAGRMDDATEALKARLAKVVVGDPRREDVRMGPLVTRAQQTVALDGIGRLAGEASIVSGNAKAPALEGIDPEKSSFVAPTLLRVKDTTTARAVHDTEVFGPVATIIPYRDEKDAFALIARGGGSLVASIYGDDRVFLARAVGELGSMHGRLLVVERSVADVHSGHGIVMPQCLHGGPGRAGNGEELGGLNGLRFYHQRVAVQGSAELIGDLQAKAGHLH
ncbi:MAG: 3,4-dehydroadipyl-CoA semialdehyde dehydrogenase [Rhizobiales bacterium]|nr:3,4-dehydroadipyl-CoA semialdehyde dehydrogenase [Hyphomicrobiales bacterium]